MLLAIDVGNTNIVLGVFDGERLAESWRLATLRERTADEVGILVTHLFERSGIALDRVSGIILSSVVPPLTRTMEEMAQRYFGRAPLTVDPGSNTGMPVLYSPPSDVGADRVVNAVAAYEAYGRASKSPVIVVDFGTATTFDAISAAGEYIGGVICPGIGISADALFQRAARLPRVDVRKPPAVIGRTTVTSMQSGLFFGYVSMVDGIVARMRAELEGGDRAACIATGGMADIIAGETVAIQRVDPDLTLQGLRMIWDRQSLIPDRGIAAISNRWLEHSMTRDFGSGSAISDSMDPSEYCREIETYLCRKNEGHLIRIVGPAFEQVCGWAQLGVPLKIAFRGIDQYCERYYAKGPRRRPVRIEFCEADILDLFDALAAGGRRGGRRRGRTRRGACAAQAGARGAHRARVVAVDWPAGRAASGRHSSPPASTRSCGSSTVWPIEAKHARGEARAQLVDRLAALDADLLAAAVVEIDPHQARRVEARGGGGAGAVRLADGARGSRPGGRRGSPAAGARGARRPRAPIRVDRC